MRTPRRIPPAIAARLVRAYRRVDAYAETLAPEVALELSAARNRKEAEMIVERFVRQVASRLDFEEAELIGELRAIPNTTVH